MIVNVKKLALERGGNDCLHVKYRVAEEGYEKRDRYGFILGEAEVRHAITCLRGEAEFYPFYDDGIHKAQFTPRGWRHLSNDEGDMKYKEWGATFPGEVLARVLEQLYEPDAVARLRTFTYDELEGIAKKYAPQIDWQYQDREDASVEVAFRRGAEQWPEVARARESLEQIASNYSDGDVVTINLSFDAFDKGDNPAHSYYFDIRKKERRVMNGGIIAHLDDKGVPHYAMHT